MSARVSPPPPDATRAQLARPVTMDHYQLTEELGRGAYGQVFKATDTRTGAPVAIKRLSLHGISPDTLATITTEIELLKNLNHRHIVKYLGSFKTREFFCIVLEYMERGALSSVIKRQHNEAFEESVVAVCIEQVLSGLAYLHQQGVVHRDIKGANILTNREGLVKLADFGVAAKLSGAEDAQDKLDVVGTTYWMAPEVIEMTGASPASDIWSVGCLAVELLTGVPPYYELQPMPALFRIVQDSRPPLPPNISTVFEAFLVACFNKDPAQRPSATALLQHPFIRDNRQELRSTWTRTIANRSRGGVSSDTHTRIDAVVQRILKADASTAGTSQDPVHAAATWAPGRDARKLQRAVTADDVGREAASPKDAYHRAASYADGAPAEADTPQGGTRTPSGKHIPTSMFSFQKHTSVSSEPAAADPLTSLLDRLRLSGSQAEPDMLAGGGERIRPLYGHIPTEGTPSGDAGTTRQDAAEVRDLVRSMRLPLSVSVEGSNGAGGWGPGALAEAQQAKALDALKVLAELLPGSQERMAAFVTEGGHVVVLELLTGDIPWLVMPTLRNLTSQLVLAVMQQSFLLEQWCMMGLVPAVLRFCRPDKPLGFDDAAWRQIRRECAFIIQNMCFSAAGVQAGRVLVACQGLPALVEFIEAHKSVDPGLTRFGIGCIWFLLDKHRALPPAVLCRLLAHHGIADRLVSSLREMNLREQARLSRNSGKRLGTDGADSGGGPPGGGLVRSASGSGADVLDELMDNMCKLLLVLAHADTAVKEQMCRLSTLRAYLGVLEGIARLQSEALLLRSVSVLRALSMDPAVLPALDQAGTIQGTMALLLGVPMQRSLPVQLEVLHTIFNLCKLKSDRARRETAASAGIMPVLVRLAAQPEPPDYDPAGGAIDSAAPRLQEELRQLAVPLLCLMTQPGNIERTRGALKQAGALPVLLDLLREEAWQHNALEALANWLAEDPYDVQKELCSPSALSRFVVLFRDKLTTRDADSLTKLLAPFLRIAKTSPQFTVEIAQHGFVPVVLELLQTQHAPAQRDLLSIIHVIYEHYPRPKELIVKYRLQEHLRLLTGNRRGEAAVLVQTQAQRLLDAFQINMVL